MLLVLMWSRVGSVWRTAWATFEADAAADLGRLHQSEALMDAQRVLLNARETTGLWLRSMVSVNHDGRGGSATDPLVWDGRE